MRGGGIPELQRYAIRQKSQGWEVGNSFENVKLRTRNQSDMNTRLIFWKRSAVGRVALRSARDEQLQEFGDR